VIRSEFDENRNIFLIITVSSKSEKGGPQIMTTHTPTLVFIGNRSHSKQILSHLLENEWNVIGAIGAIGDLAASQSGYVSLSDVCDEYRVPLIETASINEDRVISFVENLNPTLAICGGWSQIIGEELLSQPDYGIVGFHASPLPKGRGGAPVNWQIICDSDYVGVSLFQMVSEVDHGKLWAQTSVQIEERDDVSTVYNRVTKASYDILDEVLY
jgi:methionyl-tRNA formyltransferase